MGVQQPGVLLDGRVQHLAELVGRQRPELLGRERLDLLGLGLVETGVVEDARGEIDQLVAGAALQAFDVDDADTNGDGIVSGAEASAASVRPHFVGIDAVLDPAALALDHMLKDGGRGMLYLPFLNYSEFSLDPSWAMLTHPDTVPGLSDGGAHVGMICDGSFPTSNLTLWTRDRTRGARIPLAHMVRAQTRATAEAVGLFDGAMKEGA